MITSCRTIVGFTTDYLEDALSPEDRLEYERHVSLCPPCRGYLMQTRALLRAAATLPDEELSPELRTTLLEEFAHWLADARA